MPLDVPRIPLLFGCCVYGWPTPLTLSQTWATLQANYDTWADVLAHYPEWIYVRNDTP